ncbi:MAG: hypothetical protein IKI76_09585 [Selenomonadaceae bacterium]|nr:hypothetical protein [Selenomonadaceae bacterium]
MPAIKKEGTVWTLRNTKGNELKVSELGARLVSMRFRNKDFKNCFLLKDEASFVVVNGGEDFANIAWQGEQTLEGVKLSATLGGKSATVTYSISNDNEISIKYEAAGIEDISTLMTFSAEALPELEIRACQKGAAWEKIDGEKSYPVTEPAEVEMELGMFGYDPGCPIDYLNAGLKNAANLTSAAAGIDIIVYATQDKIQAQAIDGGFALKTSGNSGQTVYMIKNRK